MRHKKTKLICKTSAKKQNFKTFKLSNFQTIKINALNQLFNFLKSHRTRFIYNITTKSSSCHVKAPSWGTAFCSLFLITITNVTFHNPLCVSLLL